MSRSAGTGRARRTGAALPAACRTAARTCAAGRWLASALALALALTAGCDDGVTSSEPAPPSIDDELRASLQRWGAVPIGAMPAQDPERVELGRMLFFDPVLSGNRDVACATCHRPRAALADGRSLAVGTGARGPGPERNPDPERGFVPRHSPSLLNVGLGARYLFWDGRIADGHGPGRFTAEEDVPVAPGIEDPLVAQAMLPVLDRREMRGEPGDTAVDGRPNELAEVESGHHESVWRALVRRLLAIPGYAERFRTAFPDTPPERIRFEHAARAIAAFQRDAFTRARSPFDRYLERDDGALTAEQKQGARLFFGEAGCASCHAGPLLGGQGFAAVGAPQVGPGMAAEPPLDLGRGERTEGDGYRFAFRIPPLRNVELTAPYMHSGAYPTLEAVVHHYDDVPAAVRGYDASQLDPDLREMQHEGEEVTAALLATLDHRVRRPLELTEAGIDELVAFLESLTDPAARELGDLVPTGVPSGLPVPR